MLLYIYKSIRNSQFSPLVCHACSTGRDFIATFLPNYKTNNQKLQLVVTARESEAKVHIEVRAWFAPHQACLIKNQAFISN